MHALKSWKDSMILLATIGVSNIGDFIYLVAINILVYQLTGSAAAVAGLWIISPIVNIFTKIWTGSYIDYRSKRNVMGLTLIIRAVFIFFLPFAANLYILYTILVILSVGKAFYQPATITYVTMIVPEEKRKRFNAIRSLVDSGAFIVGPAIGGAMILFSSVEVTLWINALFFTFASIMLIFLPEKEKIDKETIPKLTFSQVANDFKIVQKFMKNNAYVNFVYLLFIILMILSYAMDTQEVVFAQQVIGLTEFEYSLLISITGIGSVIGATFLSIISNKLTLRNMIVTGVILWTIGYIIYAFSWSFASIVVGFTILGVFHVFFNTGMMTFYQNNVPVEVMGRVTSIYQLTQSAIQVMFVLIIGLLIDLISLRIMIVALAFIMLLTSIIFSMTFVKQKV